MRNNKNNVINLTDDSTLIFSSYNLIQEANSWRDSALFLIKTNKIKIPPYVMLLFSSELYLKALLSILGIDYRIEFKNKNGHNLKALYDKIPDLNLKNAIKKFKIKELIIGDLELKTFSDYLQYISNGFIEYRYNNEFFLDNKIINIPTEYIINLNNILFIICDNLYFDSVDSEGNVKKMDGPKFSIHYKSDDKDLK